MFRDSNQVSNCLSNYATLYDTWIDKNNFCIKIGFKY